MHTCAVSTYQCQRSLGHLPCVHGLWSLHAQTHPYELDMCDVYEARLHGWTWRVPCLMCLDCVCRISHADLEEWLVERGITHLLFAGVTTEVSTTRVYCKPVRNDMDCVCPHASHLRVPTLEAQRFSVDDVASLSRQHGSIYLQTELSL